MTDTVPRDVATTAPPTEPTTEPTAQSPVPSSSPAATAVLTLPRSPAQPPDLRARVTRQLMAGWQRVLGWPGWVQVLVAYGASRVLCGVVIELAARWGQNPAGVGVLNPHYLDMVQIWDGEWFKKIALHGYPSTLPHGAVGTVDYNSWAFFPVFPMLVRVVMLTGLSFSVAASVVNLLAGAGAVLVIWKLFSVRPGHDRLAVLAVAFWCVLPSAPVLQVAYTEALAALLLAGTLLLVVRRHYLWAVPVVLVLGLTRAIAAPLVAVVLWHGLLRWRARGYDPWPVRQVASWVGLLLACGVSALLWPAIVGMVTGVPDAFFQTQEAWGQRPADGPFLPWLTWAWAGLGLLGVVLLLVVVAAGARLLTSRHTAWLASELRVFGVVYPVYLLAVVRPITSMWRFLLLDLPIAAALASVAARGAQQHVRREWHWRVAAAAVVALGAMTWWTAVYLTRIPWGDSPP